MIRLVGATSEHNLVLELSAEAVATISVACEVAFEDETSVPLAMRESATEVLEFCRKLDRLGAMAERIEAQ